MKEAATKSVEKCQIQITVPKEVIKNSFQSAIQEAESLKGFYKTYNASWQNNKCNFEKSNVIGLKINGIIENLLDSKTPESDYEQLKESQIMGKKFCDIIELQITQKEEQTKISYSMKQGFSKQDPKKSRIEKNKFERQRDIFERSILSNIVIIFEQYLAQIYEFVVALNPESYFEGKTIKIKDLFSESLKTIICNEVRKQVSDNMYDSLKTLEIMKEKNNFNINRYLQIQEEFEEIYYRRNVFVHNSGRANDIYMTKKLLAAAQEEHT